MSKTSKKNICRILFAASVFLLFFCPIEYVRVVLNSGAIKSSCHVSVFTALFIGNIEKGEFSYSAVTSPALAAALVLQIVGLILAFFKKWYGIGIVSVIASWIIIYFCSCVVVNVQSELINRCEGTIKAGNSLFSLLTIACEAVYFLFEGLSFFGSVKS